MAQNVFTPSRTQVDAALRQTALDYLEGWNDGDPARMERAIHPNLAKRIVRPANPASPWWPPGDRIDVMSSLRLVQETRHDPVPEYSRSTAVRILDRYENGASLHIGGEPGEYDHLVKWNGRWVILHVLWGLRARGAGDADEDSAITDTVLDYVESCYEADGARMERCLHPELAKGRVIPNGAPPSSLVPGDHLDQTMSALTLMRTIGRGEPTPVNERRAEITILTRCANAASVRLDASSWVDYIHLCKWNSRWAIINVLWMDRRG
jgi:hypothetical protein